ncbi:hypothetical protein LTR37_005486 [Vermiconidia calcicola]|uniref:Uncharacterized protein n=1 Tax=Vermiconidia calcicola TaxID=1690605 RepID=A0ACC3NJQ5_9PEZI|nr:hypothetical protein LTR37_005486 [Vermiconidia calcicola]
MGMPLLGTTNGYGQSTEHTATNEPEWEYEYDENETEDFYFTLDVTARQSEKTPSATLPGQTEQSTNPVMTQTPSASNKRRKTGTPETTSGPGNAGKLEVLDLDSENPLIRLQDAFYSCHWSTDLGTQFYITKPGVAENPLRPGHVLDVVGISRIRLVGKPVSVRKRKGENATATVGSTAATAISVDEDINELDAVGSAPEYTPTQAALSTKNQAARFTTARQQATDPAVKAQASFLERLTGIKQKKGETDLIPFFGVKNYKPPDNKDEIRDRALAADAQRGDVATSSRPATSGRKPYKKRKSVNADDSVSYPKRKGRAKSTAGSPISLEVSGKASSSGLRTADATTAAGIGHALEEGQANEDRSEQGPRVEVGPNLVLSEQTGVDQGGARGQVDEHVEPTREQT